MTPDVVWEYKHFTGTYVQNYSAARSSEQKIEKKLEEPRHDSRNFEEMCIATKGMLFIFRFPLLFQLLLLQKFSGLSAQQCTSEESVVGMMLQRHIFKIMKPSSSLHCLQACNGHVRCQSFNYDFSDGICELNNHTKEEKPEDFIPNFTRYYFGKARKRGL